MAFHLTQSPRHRSGHCQSVVAMPLDDLVPKCRLGSYGVGKSSPKRRPVLAMITIRAGKLEPLDVRGEALRYCCSRLSEVLWSIEMCPVLASRVML